MRLSQSDVLELARDPHIQEEAALADRLDRESHCRAHLFGMWKNPRATDWERRCELCGKLDGRTGDERPA